MSAQIYRFAEIEVDTGQGCVRRNGEERHLRQQTFQVLVYLLEQKERLVTKDELLQNIWNGTAVTDDALVQCVMDIRRALGDDSRRPRFIKTIPKLGYRFIGEFDPGQTEKVLALDKEEISAAAPGFDPRLNGNEIAAVPDLPLAQSGLVANQRAIGAEGSILTRKRVVLIAVGLLIIGVVASGVYFRQRSRAARQLAEITLSTASGKKPVAVMFFDNQSGSTDLDWLREGLADMLITDLSRSGNLAVLSRQQLYLMLERIGHKESEKIRLDEALDLAKRSQAQMVIMGSFARLGEQIRIDAQLHDARDGQLLAAERLVVDQSAQVLTQVDVLSLKLASYLGGSDQPGNGLASVTTNNLAAYRYYSLGVEKAQAVQNPEAIALLEKAIALDPDFAMAYGRIGYTYVMSWGRFEEGKPYLERAFKLIDRLSEKDKLNITAWYAVANQDYAAAIRSFHEIVARYPLEVEAYRSLGRLLRGENRHDEAIEILKQGLVIDSGAKELYNSLGGTYLELRRHDEAIAMYQRYVSLAPEEPNAHDSLGLGYQWAGRYQDATQEYERGLTLKPDFEPSVIHLANTLYQQGRYREALREFQHYIEIAPSIPERARGYSGIAQILQSKGRLDDAERAARQSLANDKTMPGQMFAVLLEKRDLSAAEKLKPALEKIRRNLRGTRGNLRELPYYQGLFELKSGHGTEAIEKFKEALQHPAPTNLDHYEDCLANAYLALGRLDEAIAEYERILKLNPNYPLVHYHLAQAYEHQGQNNQARAEYERFLQVWKEADNDIPEVIAARKSVAIQT
jgi:tetratricopeptide (TPR) repeat protein/DNA-binding winged helix-turn-helix (wHTH) protein